MFALVVQEAGRAPWRKAFAIREVTIGSDEGNHLVIAGADKRHARLVLKDGKYILVDLKSSTGTYLDARRLFSPLVVNSGEAIVLANARIEIVPLAYEKLAGPLVARDRTEAELIAAIDGGDDASRTVYADWLEQRGDHARAEMLRLQQADADGDRVRELAASIDLPWRARLSQLPIENCPQLAFKCPQKWSALAATTVEGERFCGSCQKTVYYCATIDDAREHASRGHCVAIDVASARWQDDLAPPFGEMMCPGCELDVGPGLLNCPRCGERVDDNMLLGELA